MIDLVPTDDAPLWDRLVRASPGATGYHGWDWLDFQSGLQGLTIERRLVVRDDAPIGVMPLVRSGPAGILSREMPFPFLGPLVPADALAGTVRTLRRVQRGARMLEVHFELGVEASGPTTAQVLRAAGAAVVEDSTVVVDLAGRTAEQIRAAYIDPRRRNVRRAEKTVVVGPSTGGAFASVIGPVLDEAYGAHGRPSPYPADVGRQLEDWAAGRDDVSVMVAWIDAEPVGGLVALTGAPTAVHWIGGALRRHRNAQPNALLHDRMILDARAQGHPRLDLSGWVDDAVGEYKLGYGGVRRTYLVADSSLLPQQALVLARRLRRGIRDRRREAPHAEAGAQAR